MLRLRAILPLALLAGCSGTPAASGGPEEIQRLPYEPPTKGELSVGELILTCEHHLRAWQEAYAGQRSHQNRETIEFTARALGILVRRDQDRLEEQAVSGPPRNRGVASAALGFSGDEGVLPLIMNNVTDPDPMVRTNALLGVGVLAAPHTPLAPIQEAAQGFDAPDTLLRTAAFTAFRLAQRMGEDPDGGLSAILIPMLSHIDPAVRGPAAAGLGQIRAGHALPLLTRLLRTDPEAIVRTAAAHALGEIGSAGATAALAQALEDRDQVVAGTARAALVKIHGSDLGPDPEAWLEAGGSR